MGVPSTKHLLLLPLLALLALAFTTCGLSASADESEPTASEQSDKWTKRHYNRPPVRFDGPYDPNAALCWTLFPGLAGIGIGLGLTAIGAYIDSLGLIITGNAVTGVSLTVGPSLGLFYANHAQRAWTSLTVRGVLLGFSLGMWLAASVKYSSKPEEAGEDFDYPRFQDVAEPILWAMAIFGPIVGAMVLGVIDLIAAPRAANRANVEFHKRSRNWLITPTVMADLNGGTGPGLMIVGTF